MTAPGPKRCGRGGCSGLPRLSTAPTVGPCGAEAAAGVRRQRSAPQRPSWGGRSQPARLAGRAAVACVPAGTWRSRGAPAGATRRVESGKQAAARTGARTISAAPRVRSSPRVATRASAQMARRDLDKELEALRRLPGNRSCPSCSATAQFGFRDVCVKFATLVCSDCKAAHQARRHAARRAAQRASMSARVRPHDSRFRLSRLPCARGPSRQLTRRGFRRRRTPTGASRWA